MAIDYGTWEACAPGDYSDFEGDSIVILAIEDDLPRRLAVVHGSDEAARATARLIVAAPRLLGKLKEAVEFIDSQGFPSRCTVDFKALIAEAQP